MKEGARSSPGALFRRRALISTHLSYRRKFTAHRGPQFPQQKGTVQSVGGGGRLSQFNKICKHLCLGAQSCPTLCDPMDCSPPGSSVYGSLQARILEWIAMPSSRGCSQPRNGTWVCLLDSKWMLYHLSHQGSP